jgi:hypothetical protein
MSATGQKDSAIAIPNPKKILNFGLAEVTSRNSRRNGATLHLARLWLEWKYSEVHLAGGKDAPPQPPL